MSYENLPPEVRQLAEALNRDMNKDTQIAADLANGAAQFLMDRAHMINANPFLCWVLMVEIAKVNLEHQKNTLSSDPEKVRLLSRLLQKPTGDCESLLTEMIEKAVEEIQTTGKFRQEVIK